VEHDGAPAHPAQLRESGFVRTRFTDRRALEARHLIGADHEIVRAQRRDGARFRCCEPDRGVPRCFMQMSALVDVGGECLERHAQTL
jgi:hypothetical protein